MKKICVIFLGFLLPALFSNLMQAQDYIDAEVVAGYEYQNQSFGEVGAKILYSRNDAYLYRIGASALMGQTNGKFAIMPKLQADFLVGFGNKISYDPMLYLLLGLESTNKYLAPKVGVSLLNLIDFSVGYGFNYGNKYLNGKKLKGLNVGVTLNIPIALLLDKFKIL